jgi:hypothetical protein
MRMRFPYVCPTTLMAFLAFLAAWFAMGDAPQTTRSPRSPRALLDRTGERDKLVSANVLQGPCGRGCVESSLESVGTGGGQSPLGAAPLPLGLHERNERWCGLARSNNVITLCRTRRNKLVSDAASARALAQPSQPRCGSFVQFVHGCCKRPCSGCTSSSGFDFALHMRESLRAAVPSAARCA